MRKQLVRLTSGFRSHSKDAGVIPTLSSFHQTPTSHGNPTASGEHHVSHSIEGLPVESEDIDHHPLSQVTSSARHTVGFVLPEGETNEKLESEDIPESPEDNAEVPQPFNYTDHWRGEPTKSYLHSLNPFPGRLSHDNWFKIALRPFILFAYPAVLWSALVYALSIGWLIVLSESVSVIYRNRATYNFTSIQTGLVYISPFVGSIFGTAVAGKVSDLIVRWMARRNDGVYEPEFRLVMALPIALATTIGLMGFGWSAQEKDSWIVPTFFFGILSFGASLGSTTSITFCVDSYRQYAGEALVTLNFSKSIFSQYSIFQ
jgi:Major Facilitator Superfamily